MNSKITSTKSSALIARHAPNEPRTTRVLISAQTPVCFPTKKFKGHNGRWNPKSEIRKDTSSSCSSKTADFRHCPCWCSHSDLCGSQLSRPASMTGRQQFCKRKWLDFMCVPTRPKKSTAQCSACLLSSEISRENRAGSSALMIDKGANNYNNFMLMICAANSKLLQSQRIIFRSLFCALGSCGMF